MKSNKLDNNSVFYHIIIDRYFEYDKNKSNYDFKKPIFLGGNIKNIINDLERLKKLGVNYIYLSPINKTTKYHGYHITNYEEVEPSFGTISDLKILIKIIHENGMKIIIDFVPNHCSNKHPFFIEAKKSKKSKYYNWFTFETWPNKYISYLNIVELPNFNFKNKEVRKYFIETALKWLKVGIDGFRVDHTIGPEIVFWKELRAEIDRKIPNAILIGEIWTKNLKFRDLKTVGYKYKYFIWALGNNEKYVLNQYSKYFDGILDFNFSRIVNKYLVNENSVKKTQEKLKIHYNSIPKNTKYLIFLDNHDLNRFMYVCKQDKNLFYKGLDFMFKINKPIIIYYGTEYGLTHKNTITGKYYGDLEVRKPIEVTEKNVEIYKYLKNKITEKTKNLKK